MRRVGFAIIAISFASPSSGNRMKGRPELARPLRGQLTIMLGLVILVAIIIVLVIVLVRMILILIRLLLPHPNPHPPTLLIPI